MWSPPPNPNMSSPRVTFQWKYFCMAHHDGVETLGEPAVLNIGCADDPIKFGEWARHVDMDDWSAVHKYFTQADAEELPFGDQTYDTVVLGDILEHVLHPMMVVYEACRVAKRVVVFTVFEEWRLPGPGQHVLEGQKRGDEEAQRLGAKDREDHQLTIAPGRVGVPDTPEHPHLIHINAFTDDDMKGMLEFIELQGFTILEGVKAYEATHEGHQWSNWLIAAERVRT